MRSELKEAMQVRLLILIAFFPLIFGGCTPDEKAIEKPAASTQHYRDGRPFTRWWWFADTLQKQDIRWQLQWLKKQGFGGVEVAFIYPVNRNPDAERIPWISKEWTEMVTYAKHTADSLGLGCDFTFGTLWPFGGTFVPDSDATKVYGAPDFKQPLRLSWTHPDTGNVIDHLDKGAFKRYARVMGEALKPALKGSTSALFCDSWEVETRKIWTDGFAQKFMDTYGYDIQPYMDHIYSKTFSAARYDYMTLVARMVTNNFYKPLTQKAHELGALSRVQCAGAPANLLNAYAQVDIPETEAMLYEPNFAKIPASAALLAKKPIVSSETFTCLYGFPDKHFKEEYPGDLKMVADALFANGVNQIVWHGKPYNPKSTDTVDFYATVHVGPTGTLSDALKPLNRYMTDVSKIMRKGKPYSDIAVWFPVEDSRIAGEYPDSLQMPWSWGAYEMRYVHFPEVLKGYQPHWLNAKFLKQGRMKDGKLHTGNAVFQGLYVDADYLSAKALNIILKRAKQGLPVFLPEKPEFPGRNKPASYDGRLKQLMEISHRKFIPEKSTSPLIKGDSVLFRARQANGHLYIFFPHPKAYNLTLPLDYKFSKTKDTLSRHIQIQHNNHYIDTTLQFPPYQSIMLHLTPQDRVEHIELSIVEGKW